MMYHRINNKNMKKIIVKRCRVKNVPLHCIKPVRAGVILYTIVEDQVLFGLGVDSKTGELTDFGGGIKYKLDKDPIGGALREFHEETLNIFSKINRSMIGDCLTLFDERIMIIFVGVNCNSKEACDLYQVAYKKKNGRPEI